MRTGFFTTEGFMRVYVSTRLGDTTGQVEEGETKMEPFDGRTKTTGICLLGTIRHKQSISPVKQGGGIMLRR